MIVYRNIVDRAEYLVLIKGDLSVSAPTLVYLHRSDLVSDSILARDEDGFRSAMSKITHRGSGAVVIIGDSSRALSKRVRNCDPNARPQPELREYGVSSQILVDIGVKSMIMLSDREQTVADMDGYGLTVLGQEPM